MYLNETTKALHVFFFSNIKADLIANHQDDNNIKGRESFKQAPGKYLVVTVALQQPGHVIQINTGSSEHFLCLLKGAEHTFKKKKTDIHM